MQWSNCKEVFNLATTIYDKYIRTKNLQLNHFYEHIWHIAKTSYWAHILLQADNFFIKKINMNIL
jgi:hypothetical protein